jgi:hypothetical protein
MINTVRTFEDSYDVFITSIDKDYNKLKFLYESLDKLNPKPKNVYIISPTEIKDKINGIYYLNDNDVINVDRAKIKYRPNWITQQLIKLLQDITISDKYLVIDSDIYLNKEIQVFDNDKNVFFITSDQYHEPYFKFMSYYDIKKMFNRSFISEIMLFDKRNVLEYLNVAGYDRLTFIDHATSVINSSVYISEFEFYGNLVLQHFPDDYVIKNLNNLLLGKPSIWADGEIKNIISRHASNNIDIISYHSWI